MEAKSEIPAIFNDPEIKSALKDFWKINKEHETDMREYLMKIVDGIPAFAEIIRRTPKEQMDKQNAISQELSQKAIVDGQWEPWIAMQRSQGALYASMNVEFKVWFDIVGPFQKYLLPHIIAAHSKAPDRIVAVIAAMDHYINFAMSIIGEEYLRTKEKIIMQQQQAIQELSTPVLQVKERLLLIPVVGVFDTLRARHLTEQLLHAIRTHRAKVVVIDITGVPAVDSKVANHLFQTVTAARLMGARTVVTGLSAEVAQALVALGVETEKLNTVGDLQGGLEQADEMLGFKYIKIGAAGAGA